MKKKFQRLYLHIPFCASKCSYCAFYSIPKPEKDLVEKYFLRLEEEIKENKGETGVLDSIFIGGGTPSWLPPEKLEKLFKMISANFAVSKDAEISIECNPESLNSEKISIIANFANRISLGVQSFSPEFRKILGRNCSSYQIDKAFELVRESGIKNFGCDLISSIPGQSLENWFFDLESAIKTGIRHLSAYSLTYEEGTVLTKNQDWQYDDDLESEMWLETQRLLVSEGLQRYEISNYAFPGFECRHNMRIWFGSGYLGLGPAATSFDGKNRWTQPCDIKSWLEKKSPEMDIISPEARASEILAMGLRTSQGWNVDQLYEATGFKLEKWKETLKELESLGMIKLEKDGISCTRKGLLLWNEVAEMLL